MSRFWETMDIATSFSAIPEIRLGEMLTVNQQDVVEPRALPNVGLLNLDHDLEILTGKFRV
jgi:hypothetical protein